MEGDYGDGVRRLWFPGEITLVASADGQKLRKGRVWVDFDDETGTSLDVTRPTFFYGDKLGSWRFEEDEEEDDDGDEPAAASASNHAAAVCDDDDDLLGSDEPGASA